MYRSHNCGELNASNINQEVTLAGWVQRTRNKGFLIWTDLRDRYGITQLIFDESRTDKAVFDLAASLGREYVIQVKGTVIERESKNPAMATKRKWPHLLRPQKRNLVLKKKLGINLATGKIIPQKMWMQS